MRDIYDHFIYFINAFNKKKEEEKKNRVKTYIDTTAIECHILGEVEILERKDQYT